MALFLHRIRYDALKIYDCLPFNTEDDRRHLESVIEKSECHTIVQVNETFERYRFNCRSQETSEGFNTFVSLERVIQKYLDRIWHSKQTHTTEVTPGAHSHIRTMHRHLQKCRGHKRSNERNFELQQRKRLKQSWAL